MGPTSASLCKTSSIKRFPLAGNRGSCIKRTILPAFDAVRGRYIESNGSYREYKLWRSSEGYKRWLRMQWRKQNGCCHYCGGSLRGRRHNVEHVQPQNTKTRDINTARNLVLSCPDCNKDKGSARMSAQELEQFSKRRRTERQVASYQERLVSAELSWLL